MNFIFGAYAKHEQEKEDIINSIVNKARNGETNFSLNVYDDFSEAELEEIKREVECRIQEDKW